MRKLLIAVFFLAGCSNKRNELMTNLINEKKMINDSVPVFRERFDSCINAIVDKKGDSTSASRLATLNLRKSDSLKERLPAVLFSIDSLQKMK